MREDEVIQAIASIRDSMIKSKAINNPHLLSERMVELAQLNHMLTDLVIEARLAYKRQNLESYRALRDSGSSTNQAMQLAKMTDEYILAESRADKLDSFVKQTANLISACQSHIRVKMQELSQASIS